MNVFRSLDDKLDGNGKASSHWWIIPFMVTVCFLWGVLGFLNGGTARKTTTRTDAIAAGSLLPPRRRRGSKNRPAASRLNRRAVCAQPQQLPWHHPSQRSKANQKKNLRNWRKLSCRQWRGPVVGQAKRFWSLLCSQSVLFSWRVATPWRGKPVSGAARAHTLCARQPCAHLFRERKGRSRAPAT
jgi:hypothetical protein